ncbi:MAG: hypothetical protein QM737_02480 [Ferruginibacter sp.]
MSFINKSVIYARKLSVFFLFLFVFAIFLMVYFYKFIPGNREEFTNRGFRILKQFSGNIIQKNKEVKNTFINFKLTRAGNNLYDSSLKSFLKTEKFYEQLNNNLPYSIDSSEITRNNIARWDNGAIFKTDEIWAFHYSTGIEMPRKDSNRQTYSTAINIDDFLNPILETRKDIFKGYLLLSAENFTIPKTNKKDSSAKSNETTSSEKNKTAFAIVYKQGDISFSTELNADTLFKVQKNSDFANVIELDISGNKFKVFVCPFRLNEQNLMLAGLVPTGSYQDNIRSTPQSFVPIIVIIIILILVSLPYIKIFLLSPKEPIGKKDVLFTTLSIFIGSSVVVVISFYCLFEYSSHQTFNKRLIDIRHKIKVDIENEFDLAGQQLNDYVAKYHNDSFGIDEQKALIYQYKNDSIRDLVDSLLYPTIYKNTKRILWIDQQGHTMAKWNPFDFDAPLSIVTGQDYFKLFQKESPRPQPKDSSYKMIYPGKSIVTGEYLLYIVRPDHDSVFAPITKDNADLQPAYAAVMPFYSNCSEHPVLPNGFGFCLVDSLGRVLLHADEHKNLLENIIAETGDNERLQNCLKYKNTTLINNVTLYGEGCVFGVTPIKGQPISLVVFYNKNLLFDNTLRLLHFAVESLIYIYIVLALCIIFSTGISEKPTKLRFNIKRVEWIRPSYDNRVSYYFTVWYFIMLGIVTTVTFFTVICFGWDLRSIFYISLLLPLYAIWGFIAFRIKETNRFTENAQNEAAKQIAAQQEVANGMDELQKNIFGNIAIDVSTNSKLGRIIDRLLLFFREWFRPRNVTTLFIILFNVIIYIFLQKSPAYASAFWLVLLFQVLALSILGFYYFKLNRSVTNEITKENVGNITNAVWNSDIITSTKKLTDPIKVNYLNTLYLAMILIAILPAIGIITYGYQAEKIQFKKNKQLEIASAYAERQKFVFNELMPAYKKKIRDRLYRDNYYPDSIEFRAGIYLSDNDKAFPVPVTDKPGASLNLCDEPYATMMDDLFLISSIDFKSYSIKNKAKDNAWMFSTEKRSGRQFLKLNYKNKYIDSSLTGKSIVVESAINNPLKNFWNLDVFIKWFIGICVIVMAVISYWLIRSAVNRLFLLDYISSDKEIEVNHGFLDNHLKYASIKKPYFEALKIDHPVTHTFFKPQCVSVDKICSDDEYILAIAHYFSDSFQAIWESLSHGEQYFVFDFAADGYTNYKDSDTLYKLINKGIIIHQPDKFVLFSPSFRQYLLSKKGSEEIKKLKAENAIPGFWDTVRIPLLIFISVTAIFIFATQQDFSRQLTAILTSAIALPAVIMKFIEMVNSRSSGSK